MLPDSRIRPWIPALVLLLGCLALAVVNRQVVMPLVRPLEQALPDSLLGMGSVDQRFKGIHTSYYFVFQRSTK